MSLRDEALALLRGAGAAWQSMRAEGTAWEDRMVGRAQRRRAAIEGRSRPARPNWTARMAGLAELPSLGEREQHWRLWRAGAVLVRVEYEIARETVTVVAQGPRWWRWSPSLGATSGGAASRPVRVVLGPPAILLAGTELAEELEILDASRARVAGRDAYLLRGRPRGAGRGARTALREAGLGAEEYELRIDVERGALLGVSALAGGRPFRVVQAALVGFDESFAPSLFAPSSAQQGRFVTQAPRQLRVADLPESLGFAALVPDPNPSGAAPHVAVLPLDRGGAGVRAVLTWPLARDGRRGQLRLQLTAEEPPAGPRELWRAEGDVITNEEERQGMVRRRVRTLRHGTYAELESSVLDLGELAAIARSLQPVGAGSSGA